MALSIGIYVASLGMITGTLIGMAGVGGVLLVPSLVFLCGFPIQTAIPSALAAYLASGLLASAVFIKHKSLNWATAKWLCCAAVPGALLGTWIIQTASPLLLQLIPGLLSLFSGVNSLMKGSGETNSARHLHRITLLLMGLVTGLLSALSGTGGPLVMLPMLIYLKIPVLEAIGLSQAIQVPIATTSTIGNILFGQLDWRLSATVAIGLLCGVWAGSKLAHKFDKRVLHSLVSCVLVAAGILILVKSAFAAL